MVRTLRGAIVVLAAVLLGLAGALPSTAVSPSPAPSASASAPTYGCADVDAYPSQAVCTLKVVASPICVNDVPELAYNVVAVGTPITTVTITFKNPGGADIVYPDLPLSGTILWPGAVVGADGNATDWPGWTKQADGSWVAGDQFSWTRPSSNLNFEVNPGADASVSYPSATSVCANPPNTEVLADDGVVLASNSSAVLSATGSNDAPLLFAAIAFVVVGAGAVTLVTISRRRRQDV